MYDGSLEPISDQFPVFLLGKEDEESHGERIRTSQDSPQHQQSQSRSMGKDCVLPYGSDVAYWAA
jgi:hypothetical protein|tara:strand:+ start:621 stop:815 length:195 start_codon:yes stop_codon:yes gene_type:complete